MSKIVIVGFDGLQPAQISKSLTPNVHKFSTQGCFFEDHHCVHSINQHLDQNKYHLEK